MFDKRRHPIYHNHFQKKTFKCRNNKRIVIIIVVYTFTCSYLFTDKINLW